MAGARIPVGPLFQMFRLFIVSKADEKVNMIPVYSAFPGLLRIKQYSCRF